MIERPAAYNWLLRVVVTAVKDDRDIESVVRDRLGEYNS